MYVILLVYSNCKIGDVERREIVKTALSNLSRSLNTHSARLATLLAFIAFSFNCVYCDTLWSVSETASENMFTHFQTLYNHWAWLLFVIGLVGFLIVNKQSPLAKVFGGLAIGIIIGYIVINAGAAIFKPTLDEVVQDFGGSTPTN